MNKSLGHVLEIYRLVILQQHTLNDAANEVGKKNNIASSNVLSSCTRDLNISSDQFNYFLESKNKFDFKNFLFRRFPSNQDQIISFFNSFEDTSEIPVLDMSKIVKSSVPDEKISLSSQVLLSTLKEKFLDWIIRDDVPHDVREELKSWIRKLEG